jgi:serralysin
MSYVKYDGALAAVTGAAGLSFFGTDGADTMAGTAAAEAFWGGGGDLMTGGAGDDTFYLKSANDRVVEAIGGGVDRIVAWTSVNLGDHLQIENLTVGGDGTYGAGNALDNIVEGQAGAQQLYGGFGQDVLIGGAGADVFIVNKGEGNDVIQDFAFGQDKVRLKAGLSSFDQVKARMSQAGADVKVDLGGGDALVFRNATVDQFSARDFQLELNPTALGAKTFGDEFSGQVSIWDRESNPNGVWRPDYGYQGSQGVGSYTLVSNDEKQIYTSPYYRDHAGDFSESPFVANPDGTLSIWARPSTNAELFGHGYTSGLLTTKESFSQTYGYFEMRADLPDAAGAWPAFWMLPTDGSWPPELDIMEALTRDSNGLWTTQHSGLGGHTSDGQLSFVPDTTDGFHTYGALWGPSEIVWYVDNVEAFRSATPADMHKPMFLLANLALGGWGGAIDQAGLPAEFKIDYIRAYSLGDVQSQPPVEPTPAPTPTPVPQPEQPDAVGVALTGASWGEVLAGGAGADTLTAGVGGEQLTGGGGGDRFVFKQAAVSHADIRDFQVGVDKLDLSTLLNGYAGTNPVADGRLYLLDDGAGGTNVLVDLDGSGGAWPVYVARLHGVPPSGLTAETLLGGAQAAPPASLPPSTPPGLSLGTGQYADTLAGGAGADTLNAGLGPDRLTGGAGADRFVFDQTPWEASTVHDFAPGVDKLDLSGLLDGAGYVGADPVADGYVKLIANAAGGTWVYFDRDGTAAGDQWGTFIVTVEGVAPTALQANDWIF